jgi:hypothetical protein
MRHLPVPNIFACLDIIGLIALLIAFLPQINKGTFQRHEPLSLPATERCSNGSSPLWRAGRWNFRAKVCVESKRGDSACFTQP